MKDTVQDLFLEKLVAPLGECLTPESARRILALKADPDVQQRVRDLAERHTRGLLSPEETSEYRHYVSFATFVAVLKSKARRHLTAPDA